MAGQCWSAAVVDGAGVEWNVPPVGTGWALEHFGRSQWIARTMWLGIQALGIKPALVA